MLQLMDQFRLWMVKTGGLVPDATANGPVSNLGGKRWRIQILKLQLMDHFRIWKVKMGDLDPEATINGHVFESGG